MTIKSLAATCSALLAWASPLMAAEAAPTPHYTVLYHFANSQNGEAGPEGTLAAFKGSLYGTVEAGGSAGKGTIFQLDLASLAETTVYSFLGGATDGAVPFGPLTRVGPLIYGSTIEGYGTGPGSNGNYTGYGAIWRLDANTGKYQVVHGFDGNDGSQPYSGVTPVDRTSYGVTWYGGPRNTGSVFKMDALGALLPIYDFPDRAIGCNPLAAVTVVGTVLYGTTTFCGAHGAGTVYAIDLNSGQASVLYSFAANGSGSAQPNALVYQNGVLYGTTFDDGGAGTVYAIKLKTGQYTLLHQFSGGADGGTPSSGLTPFGSKLYGVTEIGGAGGFGTIYSVDPVSGSQTVVYSFTSGSNGDTPFAGLLASGGALYGSTLNVDAEYPNIRGALFKFVPEANTVRVAVAP